MIPGYTFRDPALADEALTHPSLANERHGMRHYERLEFLGDAVVQLVVTEMLMEAHPDWQEGPLTFARVQLVQKRCLAQIAQQLGLPALLRLPRRQAGVGKEERVWSQVFEAVLGAIFTDGGIEAARSWARPLFAPMIDPAALPPARDAKSALQEWCQAHDRPLPKYITTKMSDSAARQSFEVEVHVGGQVVGQGTGSSKKEAQKAAATAAMAALPFAGGTAVA